MKLIKWNLINQILIKQAMKKIYLITLLAVSTVSTLVLAAAEPNPAQRVAAKAKLSVAQQHLQLFKCGKNEVEWYHNNSFAVITVPKKELVVTNKGVFRPLNGRPANAEPVYNFFPFTPEGKAGPIERGTTYSLVWGKNMRNPSMQLNR